jgi:hypothetical protein
MTLFKGSSKKQSQKKTNPEFLLNVEDKQKIWNYLKILIYFVDVEMGVDTKQRNKDLKLNFYSALS